METQDQKSGVNGNQKSDSYPYGDARQKTGEVIDQAQEKAGEVVDQIREQATNQITSQKDRIAEGINRAAYTLLMASDQLRQNNQEGIAQYTDQVADKMENASRFIRERQISDLVWEVENFARREPVLFLGGAFTVGLLAARFLKSSNPSQRTNSNANSNALARRQDDSTQASTHAPLTPRPVTGQDAGDYATEALQNEQSSVARHFGESTSAGQAKQAVKLPSQNQNTNKSNVDLL